MLVAELRRVPAALHAIEHRACIVALVADITG